MAEDAPPENTPPSPPSQNLIMGLLLGAMVLVVVLVVLTRNSGTPDSADKQLAELRALVASKQAELNAESERLGLGPVGATTGASNIKALANKVSNDASYLSTLSAGLEESMSAQATRLANAEATRDSLGARIRDLNEELAEAQARAGSQQQLRNQITDLEARLTASQERVASLQDQLAKSPAASEVQTLRQQLLAANSERDRLAGELANLQSSTASMVKSDELDDLRSKVARLEPENNRLRYELQRLQAMIDRADLFVESTDDLAPVAMRLIKELRTLHDAQGPSEIKDEYMRINAELKASVIDTISFATDSSRIDFDKAEMLRRLLANTDPESFLLVVGYASTTGDAAHNQKLSSERATRVVSVVNQAKKDGQKLQALFFGQTDRFSTTDPTRNQICEIWEIRK